MSPRKKSTSTTSELLRAAVAFALDTIVDVGTMWQNAPRALTDHVVAAVRRDVTHTNGTPMTDEEIVDALVAELRRRGVKTNGKGP